VLTLINYVVSLGIKYLFSRRKSYWWWRILFWIIITFPKNFHPYFKFNCFIN